MPSETGIFKVGARGGNDERLVEVGNLTEPPGDLTTVPPVLRTMDPAVVKIAEGASLGASWRHASVVASYNDAELAAILEYLRAAGN